MKALDLVGERYGRLTVIGRQALSMNATKNRSARWKCRCECGRMTIVSSRNLRSKTHPTRSCGCLQKEWQQANLGGFKVRWTDEERDAAEDLFRLWDIEWKRQLHAYPALAGRTTESVASYIKNFLRPAPMQPKKPVTHGAWPAPGILINGRFVGKRLFEIDQDAVLDHGSFGNISRAVNYSASGCSARWASEAA